MKALRPCLASRPVGPHSVGGPAPHSVARSLRRLLRRCYAVPLLLRGVRRPALARPRVLARPPGRRLLTWLLRHPDSRSVSCIKKAGLSASLQRCFGRTARAGTAGLQRRQSCRRGGRPTFGIRRALRALLRLLSGSPASFYNPRLYFTTPPHILPGQI